MQSQQKEQLGVSYLAKDMPWGEYPKIFLMLSFETEPTTVTVLQWFGKQGKPLPAIPWTWVVGIIAAGKNLNFNDKYSANKLDVWSKNLF